MTRDQSIPLFWEDAGDVGHLAKGYDGERLRSLKAAMKLKFVACDINFSHGEGNP